MKSSVIIFPGSNCDRDMDVALKKFGFKNKMVWHNDNVIPKSDLVVLPGGFSYGDYLRCGSIAAKSNIINSVIEFANKGGLVIGICNGFQILIETGLVTGALLRNKYLKFICKNIFVKANKLIRFIKILLTLNSQIWKFCRFNLLLRCVLVCLQKSEANRKKIMSDPRIDGKFSFCP